MTITHNYDNHVLDHEISHVLDQSLVLDCAYPCLAFYLFVSPGIALYQTPSYVLHCTSPHSMSCIVYVHKSCIAPVPISCLALYQSPSHVLHCTSPIPCLALYQSPCLALYNPLFLYSTCPLICIELFTIVMHCNRLKFSKCLFSGFSSLISMVRHLRTSNQKN